MTIMMMLFLQIQNDDIATISNLTTQTNYHVATCSGQYDNNIPGAETTNIVP